jgi:PadR family transcriptional regulator PadR
MSTTPRTQSDFLNGVPELLLLRLLARQPMYGYELVQAIRRASGARLDFGEGCIYPVLHRLERTGLLASRRELVGGRGRIVYRLTLKGQRQLVESVSLWRQVVGAVNRVLQGGADAEPSMA